MKIIIIILLLLFLLGKTIFELNKKENFKTNNKVLLLMRSYNRPKYLKETLKYLDSSDIFKRCAKRIIYDDNSNNKETLQILKKYENKYDIMYNNQNYKQYSMVRFLNIIDKNYDNYDYVCYIDNDAISKPNLINQCLKTFNQISKEQNLEENKIILTGFNTSNHKTLNDYNKYVEKKSIGGIHMFFHKSLLKKIIKWWEINKDWGIVNGLKKEGGKLYASKPSIIEHIGEEGDHSNKNKYDKSIDF